MAATSVFLDLSNDNVSLAIEGAEGPAEPLEHVEQSGDGLWDEESQALRQARKDAELTSRSTRYGYISSRSARLRCSTLSRRWARHADRGRCLCR
jgi:hypothetical protein